MSAGGKMHHDLRSFEIPMQILSAETGAWNLHHPVAE
jgi:hypothetical protein